MTFFEKQYLVTQYGLLVATIFFYWQLVRNDNRRDRRAIDAEIKHWCKCVFRSVDSPGALQRAGQTVRSRFPNSINLILIAYEELQVEAPLQHRPVLYKFLQAMEGIESGKWPSAVEAMSGKLDIYK
ncbi:MAG: hypothetical protein HYV97_02795 [Bdellovibrio sp.]|nr:hypothetical protein [Bdellovibrio sp.]